MGNPRSGCNKPQCAVGAIRTLTWLIYRDIVQLVERQSGGLEATGSSPVISTTADSAAISIDTPVINPARILVDLHRDTRKFNQHRLFSASCRLYESRRARPSSLRIEPRGVKSDEIPTLWEETSVVLAVVYKRRRGIESVTAGVWRPKSARRERARLGD